MYPRSTILGNFVLFILLLVTSSTDSRKDFLPDYEYYDVDGDGNLDRLGKSPRIEYICLLVSLPFLLLTFVVYSVLPEFDNIHGYTLRSHVVSLFVINVINIYYDDFPKLSIRNSCLLIAYICNFSRLSSVFWLNVICFDTWWTLRQFRSYQTILKKQEKKKFIMYSIYVWGISLVHNVICAILDIPSISKHLGTSPEMCVEWASFSCFRGMVYFYVPVAVSVIVNICLFIAMLTIWYHDKQTANQLRNSRSSCHNNNKFTVYVKLSIVLGLNWITRIIWWLTAGFALTYDKNVDIYLKIVLWHITELIDIFQGVIIFFAFVWKKKIMLLLLKRFGCKVRESVTNISINNDRPCASPSPTTPLTAEIVPIQEITPSNQQINHRAEFYSQ